MEPKTNTAVPLDCDPSIPDQLAPEFITGHTADGQPVMDGAFTIARAVFVGLSDAAALMGDADANIRRAGITDPITTDRLRTAATKQMVRAQKLVADGLSALEARADQVQAAIDNEALNLSTTRLDVNENARAGEIRRFLAGLPREERLETIRKAITIDKDRAVASAVLSNSPWAVGLSAKDAEFIRADAERVFAPDLFRLRSSLARLRALVENAGTSIVKRYGALTGVGGSRAAAAQRSLTALEKAGGQNG